MAHERLHHTSTTTSCAKTLASYSKTSKALNACARSLPIKFVAAEAGFLPPGPAVDLADMIAAQRFMSLNFPGIRRDHTIELQRCKRGEVRRRRNTTRNAIMTRPELLIGLGGAGAVFTPVFSSSGLSPTDPRLERET
jgi:hypothetical protein